MKSNISTKEINSGKEIINQLFEDNPRILPCFLKKVVSKYQKFTPDIKKYGLWLSKKKKSKINSPDKILFLVGGLAASGKDSIYNEMVNLTPNLFHKAITATSRPPREGEINEIDYFFYKTNDFLKSLKNDEFLEFIKRGDSYYGLPKKSIDYAFNQPKPIIYCQIEMSGWTKLEKYVKSKNPNVLIIKEFIFPDMTVSEYVEWLKEKRVNEDLDSRINKSGWEIKKAASKADFILTNRIRENIPTLTYLAKTVINQIKEISQHPDIPVYQTPTDNLPKNKNTEEIINSHDSII
jgi:guanylate kinase